MKASLKQGTINWLESLRFTVPMHGNVTNVSSRIRKDLYQYGYENYFPQQNSMQSHVGELFDKTMTNLSSVVVYEKDEKILMHFKDALELFPNNYCTRYHSSRSCGSFSKSVYLVGKQMFIVQGDSENWNSKKSGTVNVTHRMTIPKRKLLTDPVCRIGYIGESSNIAIGYTHDPDLSILSAYVSSDDRERLVDEFMMDIEVVIG